MIWIIFLFLNYFEFTLSNSNPSNNLLSPFGECFEGFTPTFLRFPGTRHIDGPAFVVKIDMVTCASHCRSNFDPASEEQFPCEAFNFRAGRNPICEFFPATGNNKTAKTSLKIDENPTFYYEKVCLKMAKRCEEASYLYDVKKGVRIEETPNRIINVTNVNECMEECINIQCQSFGFHHDAKRCSFYSTTKRESTIIRDSKMDYFENNCIHPSSRCPNGRIEFVVTRKADVPSFGLSLGVKSIRSCMQACINAPQFFCRSVQFDSMSNECFISDETSDVAVPSSNLDIYEPFCVAKNDENTCNRPYTFEKTITSRIQNSTLIVEIPNQSTEKCLQKCVDIETCKSINYNVLTRKCALLSTPKTESISIGDENFDSYELKCPRINNRLSTKSFNQRVSTTSLFRSKPSEETTTQTSIAPKQEENSSEMASNYKLIVRSRQLLFRFRWENFTDVDNVQDCWKLCLRTLNCKIITFSSVLNLCVVTNFKISDHFDYRKISQPSDSTDLYSSSEIISDVMMSKNEKNGKKFINASSTSTSTVASTTSKLSETSSSESSDELNIFEINESFMEPEETTIHNNGRVRAHSLPNAETRSDDKSSSSSSLLPIDPELVGLEDATPQQLPISAGVSYVDPDLLSIEAECRSQGINITFDLENKANYTGVIYASERFDQCRVFVKNSTKFSIFIPRPKHNSWCNAVEINNEMSTIIIMSNDRILPHDVTTKDDLFYQVSCDYNQKENDETIINKGIVVGGPSPILITKKNEVKEIISLEITKEGKPVESVFVGESLIATVRSNISADSIRIVDCTAYRVGGLGPPASVNLIANGCALLPSIMSPMKITKNGWQSSLSAFRIDGSEQIDVVCIISMCGEEKCAEISCPSSNSDTERSTRSTSSEETSIRIDRRLFVKSDQKENEKRRLFGPICIESSTYLPGLVLFSLSLISIAISVFLTFRKNRRNDAQVEELLAASIAQESGPKYIKTMSM